MILWYSTRCLINFKRKVEIVHMSKFKRETVEKNQYQLYIALPMGIKLRLQHNDELVDHFKEPKLLKFMDFPLSESVCSPFDQRETT